MFGQLEEDVDGIADADWEVADAKYDETLLASWLPSDARSAVPPIILDRVVGVPLEEDAGTTVASGPADATVAGQQDQMDADVEAAKQARYISAFEPTVTDLNTNEEVPAEVTALLQQLENLDNAAQRSVAAEVESAVEGGASLIHDVGRARILEICRDVRERCKRLDRPGLETQLQKDMASAARGTTWWQTVDGAEELAHLVVPRAKVPLSLWDWQVWSQARPTLWRYGDAGNLYPARDTNP